MNFASDEKPLFKVITAGDEVSLEEKLNEYITENPSLAFANLDVSQVEYHSRGGTVDFGLMAVLTMRVKK